MTERPTHHELLSGVVDYLDGTLKPKVPDDEAYPLRIAIALLRTIQRELRASPCAGEVQARALAGAEPTEDARRALARALREGRVALDDPALIPTLRALVEARIAIDQPKYPSYVDVLARGYPGDVR